MNSINWREAIEAAKNGSDTLFSKVVAQKYESHFHEAITVFTKDKDFSRSIYITTMTKFWERFVINGEKLPETSIDGYIFQMTKNAFLIQKREGRSYKHSFIKPMDTIELVEKYSSKVAEHGSIENTESLGFDEEQCKVIHKAIKSLDKICQEIIEQNILNNVTLQSLRDELGLKGTYGAIVQKKKRCINRLRKILLKEMKTTDTFSFIKLKS